MGVSLLIRSSQLSLLAALAVCALPATATGDAQLIRAGRFQQARVELEQDLKTSDSAAAHCNLGIALLHLRNYRPALEHLLRATTMDSTLTPAWLNLAACYICLNEFDRAIAAYKKVEILMPQSTPALNQLIDFLGNASRSDETTPDYAQSRWKQWDRSKVVRVYIAHHARYRPIALQQLAQIQRAAHLQLVPAESKESADLLVDWIDPPKNTMLLERGTTSCVARNGKIVGAIVEISIGNETGLDFLSDETMRKACLHEFLHALGIEGHSSCVEDVMFPMIELPTVEGRLTERDKATIRQLYQSE